MQEFREGVPLCPPLSLLSGLCLGLGLSPAHPMARARVLLLHCSGFFRKLTGAHCRELTAALVASLETDAEEGKLLPSTGTQAKTGAAGHVTIPKVQGNITISCSQQGHGTNACHSLPSLVFYSNRASVTGALRLPRARGSLAQMDRERGQHLRPDAKGSVFCVPLLGPGI